MSLSGSVFQRRNKSAIVPPSDCRRWDGFALPRTVFVAVIALIASTALMLAVPNDAAAQTDSAKVKTQVRLDSRAEGDRILITNVKDPSKARVTVHLDEAKKLRSANVGFDIYREWRLDFYAAVFAATRDTVSSHGPKRSCFKTSSLLC